MEIGAEVAEMRAAVVAGQVAQAFVRQLERLAEPRDLVFAGPLEVDPEEGRLAELADVFGPLVDLLGFVLAEQQRVGHVPALVRR